MVQLTKLTAKRKREENPLKDWRYLFGLIASLLVAMLVLIMQIGVMTGAEWAIGW